MKKLLLGLLVLGSVSSFASSIYSCQSVFSDINHNSHNILVNIEDDSIKLDMSNHPIGEIYGVKKIGFPTEWDEDAGNTFKQTDSQVKFVYNTEGAYYTGCKTVFKMNKVKLLASIKMKCFPMLSINSILDFKDSSLYCTKL